VLGFERAPRTKPLAPPDEAAAQAYKDVQARAATAEEKIKWLASLPPLERAMLRKDVAKELDINLSDVDREIARILPPEDEETPGQGHKIELYEPEPWPEPVSGAALLDEIVQAIGRFAVIEEYEKRAVALWVVASHAFDIERIFPRLLIKAPDANCGKSTLKDVVAALVTKACTADNATAAALFRLIELQHPTLLLDECDTFLKDNEDLRGIVNSGFQKGGNVLRTVGENFEARAFETFAPMVLTTIGSLARTIESRSLTIQMKRKRAGEQVERLTGTKEHSLKNTLARKIARFVQDNRMALTQSKPPMPKSLVNRDGDNWLFLFSIADVAGGEWSRLARQAAIELLGLRGEQVLSNSAMMLSDIRGMFRELLENKGQLFVKLNTGRFGDPLFTAHKESELDRASCKEIASYLNSLPHRPWLKYNRGKGIAAPDVTKALREYGIHQKRIRMGDGLDYGYLFSTLEDALSRYLEISDGTMEQEEETP
jgi:hypothetical protein